FNCTAGSSHTIATDVWQGSGTRYVFANWSDSGAISHMVAPTVATTYTATFTTMYLLTAEVTGFGNIVVSPEAPFHDFYYSPGTSVQLRASDAPSSVFQNWSGDASGST